MGYPFQGDGFQGESLRRPGSGFGRHSSGLEDPGTCEKVNPSFLTLV